MRIEVFLESYNEDETGWEQNVKMTSEEDHTNRVVLLIDESAIGIESPYTLTFMAEDLRAAIDACCGPAR